MMKKIGIIFLLISSKLMAVQCYFTIAKSACWKNYDVDVTLIDTEKEEVVQTIHIPKNSPFMRVHFECQPKQVFAAYAQFSPVVWEQDQGKKYQAVRFWAMPELPPKPGAIWGINICYPGHFSNLPTPQSDITDCGCDFSTLPVLENPNQLTDNAS